MAAAVGELFGVGCGIGVKGSGARVQGSGIGVWGLTVTAAISELAFVQVARGPSVPPMPCRISD